MYGQGRIAQQQTNMQYFGADGLGNVRQLYNSSGQIVANKRYDPFGNSISQSGVGTSNYGFTGEWTDATGLEYLRARYYAPVHGQFITKDVWEGDYTAPLTLNRWNYTNANPANLTDPSGRWRWALTSSIYHEEIEDYYEGTFLGTLNPNRQLEYGIQTMFANGILGRVDMFDSLSGDVFEIEPVGKEIRGQNQVARYVRDLLFAARANELKGTYFGVASYDWNRTPFHLGGEGGAGGWQRKMRKPLPYYPEIELVADHVSPGLIVYWLEPRKGVPATQPVVVPNPDLLRKRNWIYGTPKLEIQPVYGFLGQACGQLLVFAGVTIIIVTIAEDASVIGTVDDIVTVRGGMWLIDLGRRIAAYVTVSVPAIP